MASSLATETVQGSRERWSAIYERGLERCRDGNWDDGLVDLAFLAEQRRQVEVPALCYSYLGYGLAHHRGQIKKGLRLCRHAIKLEFYQPECYVNLARSALLSEKYRYQAANAVESGLAIDPDHHELLELQRQLGARRPPVLSFLSRGNVLN
ncbi:MAG: hypothetical protein AAF657_41200, partial [Acidobacteriota bacterium]